MTPIDRPLAATHSIFTRSFIAFLAALYFVMVLTSSTQHSMGQVTKGSSFGQFLDYIGFLSGASNHFGFFAPGVLSQFRATYETKDAAGQTLDRGDVNQGNFETTFRFHNMIENFWTKKEDDSMRRALSASWASRLLGQNPNASKVQIKIEAYVIPSMRQYRVGERPHWIPHYSAEFLKEKKS